MAGLAVIGIVLGAVFGGGDSSAQQEAARTTSAKALTVTVPNVTGKTGDVAKKALVDAGFDVEFDAGDDYVVLPSNWNVTAQTPKGNEQLSEGSTVTLKAVKKPVPTETAAPAAPADPTPTTDAEPATTAGLTATYAQSACDQYGESAAPYGWKPHFITGLLNSAPQGDHWFLKFNADVTNQFNAERSVVVECKVTGTNASATVSEFDAY